MSTVRAPKRIVLVTLGAIGDALMVASAADTASERVQDVIILATRNVETIRTLVRGNTHISVFPITFPTLSMFVVGKPTVVCFPPTFGVLPKTLKGVAALLTLIPQVRTVGFQDRGSWQPYTRTIRFDPSILFIENLENLLIEAGIPVKSLVPHAVFTPVLSETPKHSMFIHPFAANLKRSLPPRRWQTLVNTLEKTYPNHTLYVSAFGAETEQAQEWFKATRVTFLINRPIDEIAGYLTKADVYIGVDTGITHLAGVFHVPSVVIGNQSNPTWLPIYNPHARILTNDTRCTCTGDKGGDCTVYEDGKPYYRCLYDIEDTDIIAAVKEINRVD